MDKKYCQLEGKLYQLLIPLMTLLTWKIPLGIPYRAGQAIGLIISCSPPISECEPCELRVEKTSHPHQLANQTQANFFQIRMNMPDQHQHRISLRLMNLVVTFNPLLHLFQCFNPLVIPTRIEGAPQTRKELCFSRIGPLRTSVFNDFW